MKHNEALLIVKPNIMDIPVLINEGGYLRSFMRGGISSKKLRQIFLRRSGATIFGGVEVEIDTFHLKKE